jgi:hypothetical protein
VCGLNDAAFGIQQQDAAANEAETTTIVILVLVPVLIVVCIVAVVVSILVIIVVMFANMIKKQHRVLEGEAIDYGADAGVKLHKQHAVVVGNVVDAPVSFNDPFNRKGTSGMITGVNPLAQVRIATRAREMQSKQTEQHDTVSHAFQHQKKQVDVSDEHMDLDEVLSSEESHSHSSEVDSRPQEMIVSRARNTESSTTTATTSMSTTSNLTSSRTATTTSEILLQTKSRSFGSESSRTEQDVNEKKRVRGAKKHHYAEIRRHGHTNMSKAATTKKNVDEIANQHDGVTSASIQQQADTKFKVVSEYAGSNTASSMQSVHSRRSATAVAKSSVTITTSSTSSAHGDTSAERREATRVLRGSVAAIEQHSSHEDHHRDRTSMHEHHSHHYAEIAAPAHHHEEESLTLTLKEFQQMDANGDGVVDSAEFAAALKSRAQHQSSSSGITGTATEQATRVIAHNDGATTSSSIVSHNKSHHSSHNMHHYKEILRPAHHDEEDVAASTGESSTAIDSSSFSSIRRNSLTMQMNPLADLPPNNV